jgi:hypothetical protein
MTAAGVGWPAAMFSERGFGYPTPNGSGGEVRLLS